MNAAADKKIQFFDLQAQQNLIREKINERINRVLDHGKYIMGPEVQELEEVLTNYVGAKLLRKLRQRHRRVAHGSHGL